MDYDRAVNSFQDFYKGKNDNQNDQKFLDYKDLDLFDPELSEYLKENPASALDAAREAVAENFDIKDPKVFMTNMPEEDLILPVNVEPSRVNMLTGMKIKVKDADKPKMHAVSGIFECIACGDRYEKEQDGNKMKSPYKCECGSKDFNVVERIVEDIQEIEPLTGWKNLTVRLRGPNVENPYKLEDNEVVVYGILKNKETNSTESGYLMDATNIEIES